MDNLIQLLRSGQLRPGAGGGQMAAPPAPARNPFTPAPPTFNPNTALAAMANAPTIPVMSTQSTEVPMPIPGDPLSYLPPDIAARAAAAIPQGGGFGTQMVGAPPAPPGGVAATGIPAGGSAIPPDIAAIIANARSTAGVSGAPGAGVGREHPGGRPDMANRPDLGAYMPQGLANVLSMILTNPNLAGHLDRLLGGGFGQMLARFGVTPEQITAEGFDPNSIYTRQEARQDWRAGNPVQAPGFATTQPVGTPQPIDPVAAAQASGLGSGGTAAPAPAQAAPPAQGANGRAAMKPSGPNKGAGFNFPGLVNQGPLVQGNNPFQAFGNF